MQRAEATQLETMMPHPGTPAGSPPPRVRALSVILAFLATLALFSTGAVQREIWRSDEHRYVEVAREMTTPPGDLLVPHLGGEVYVKKPPLYFWAVIAARGVFDTDWGRAGPVPSALATAISTAALLALATPLYGSGVAAGAAFVFATTSTVLSLATRANLDALLSMFVTLSLLFYVRVETGHSPRARRAACIASGLMAGLGMMVKGPVALAFPAMIAGTHQLLTRGRSGLRLAPSGLWIASALVPGVLWLGAAAAEAGRGYAEQLLIGHGVGHPLGLVNKQRPFWYYPKALLVGFLPWTLFLPTAVALIPRRPLQRLASADAFTLAWSIVPLVVLSLFPAKRNVYLLPMYPGLALWIALSITRSRSPAREGTPRLARRLARGGQRVWGFACLAGASAGLGIAVAGLTERPELAALVFEPWPALAPSVGWGALIVLGLSSIALIPGGWIALTARDPDRGWKGVTASVLVAAVAMLSVVYPAQSRGEAEGPFFRAIAPRVNRHPALWYGESDFSANWMLSRSRIPILEDRAALDAFLIDTHSCLYLFAEDLTLREEGLPPRVIPVLEWPRALSPGLVLLIANAQEGESPTPDCPTPDATRPRAAPAPIGPSSGLRAP